MHVAIVGQLPADRTRPEGGVAAVTANLIRGLVAKDVRVTAIEWGSPREEPFEDADLQCKVFPVPVTHPAVVANWLCTSRRVSRIVDEVRPDIVHVECVPELGWTLRYPRVFSVHGIAYRDEWLYTKWQRYVTCPLLKTTFWLGRRKFRHIIIHNKGVLSLTGPMRHARLHEIDNAVEPEFFQIERKPFSPTVLFVGRLCALKNTLGLVQVADKVRRVVPDVRFRLVGPWSFRDDPTYCRAVEAFCREHDLAETVTFPGLLGRAEIMEELSKAGCLVLPSFQEMAPAVISEAMAAGVPVAASRISGIPYMVDDGKTGLLFDPSDPGEIAERLTTLLTNHQLRERMSDACRRSVVERYHPDVVARQHIEVYRQVLDDSRR